MDQVSIRRKSVIRSTKLLQLRSRADRGDFIFSYKSVNHSFGVAKTHFPRTGAIRIPIKLLGHAIYS